VERCGQRGDDEDVASALDHVREARTDRAPHAQEVDLNRPLERGRIGGADHADGRDAGVGHDDVDAAEALDSPLHGALERLGIGHIALEPRGVRAALRRHPLELVGLEAHQRHVGAPSRHPPGRLGTEAACSARDQHRLPASRPVLHEPEP
jgi:hypothetical protein